MHFAVAEANGVTKHLQSNGVVTVCDPPSYEGSFIGASGFLGDDLAIAPQIDWCAVHTGGFARHRPARRINVLAAARG